MAAFRQEDRPSLTRQSLPDLCSRLDKGAGVFYKDNFLIFTKRLVPWQNCHQSHSSEASVDLQALADRVSQTIKIHLDLDSVHEDDVHGFDYPHVGPRTGHLPYFFLNASSQDPSHFAIAGLGTSLDTLTSLLRRPWCVLELCCTTTGTVKALFHLAEAICKYDDRDFAAAKQILDHELICRKHSQCRPAAFPHLPSSSFAIKIRSDLLCRIRSLSLALFRPSEQSFHGIWVRAICVCAVYFDLGISNMGHTIQHASLSTPIDRRVWEQADPGGPGNSSPASACKSYQARPQELDTTGSTLADLISKEPLPLLYHRILQEVVECRN